MKCSWVSTAVVQETYSRKNKATSSRLHIEHLYSISQQVMGNGSKWKNENVVAVRLCRAPLRLLRVNQPGSILITLSTNTKKKQQQSIACVAKAWCIFIDILWVIAPLPRCCTGWLCILNPAVAPPIHRAGCSRKQWKWLVIWHDKYANQYHKYCFLYKTGWSLKLMFLLYCSSLLSSTRLVSSPVPSSPPLFPSFLVFSPLTSSPLLSLRVDFSFFSCLSSGSDHRNSQWNFRNVFQWLCCLPASLPARNTHTNTHTTVCNMLYIINAWQYGMCSNCNLQLAESLHQSWYTGSSKLHIYTHKHMPTVR